MDDLLQRYKNLEKGILKGIAKTVETQKSLENLNKIILDIYLKCKALNFFFKKDIN